MVLHQLVVVFFKIVLLTIGWRVATDFVNDTIVFEGNGSRILSIVGIAVVYVLLLNAVVLYTLEKDHGSGT